MASTHVNTHDSHAHGAEAPPVHVLPLSLYFGILGALIFLTVVTVLTAQLDLGPFNLPIAMVIATTKASLVLAVFMHLWFDNKLNLVIFVASLLFLAIFIIVTMLDTEGRDLVDPIRRNFLPRDEQVQQYLEKNPGADALRPGLVAPQPGQVIKDEDHGGGEAHHAE